MARDYYDESKPKKKKKETPKPQKVTKSPSVTKVNNKASNSTFMGGGSAVKKTEQRTSAPAKVTKPSERVQRTPARSTTPQRATDTGTRNQTSRTSRLTDAQYQKTYGTPRRITETAEDKRKEREERRLAAQRQKSGLNDQPTAAQKAATDRALKNTLPIAKESAKGAAYGHLTTLNDIASIKSQGNGKSREEIYDPNLAEKSRQQAEERVKKYQAKTQETEDAIQKLTKNAKGLEKAYYGAVESGTGMLTDIGIGALTGTGQVGSLAAMFSRTYGSTRGKAQQEGATEAEDRAYAAAQAAKEVGTELMFPGAGLARGYAGKQGLKLADTAANILTRNLRGRAADLGGAGVRLLGGVLEENAEEVAGWGLDPLIKEITYGKNARTRNAQQAMKERSNALRAEIQNEDDARAAAAYLSSDDFFEQTVNAYREAGLSKKDAEEVADRMRDYLTASLTGDTDSMEQIEDEVSKKVAGTKKLEWDFDELKDTIASTTLLTAATGLPGTGMTAVKGAALRDQLGDDGVRALTNTAIDFEDSEMSLKAKAMKARLDSGNELTSTQVYDLQVGMQEQIRKDTQREESSRRMADKRIKSDNLLTPYRQNENGGIDLDEATEASYREHVSRANEIIDGLTSETKESLTANEKVDGSKAIAGFQTGVFTIEDANTLNYSNTTVRAAFEEATGVDLGQYVVKNKDGSVNIPATNTATKDALFAMAADNLVKSAQAETENWMDNTKGQVVTQVSARMGASGSAVLQQALDDVDERDRSKYMMTANATDMLYQAARNMGTEWSDVASEATKMFPGISESKLKMIYEAGLADREMANDKARGRQVRMGEALSEMGEQETATGKVFIDTKVPVKGSVIRTFTEIAKNLGADIHFVDYIYDSENNPIAGANGSYDPNTNTFYLNVATGAETNIGYIFMHETTHYLKTYAPEQYQALENLVRERWFAFNPSQMQDAIARKIEAYKRATKGQQVLTEEQALEEIIADASHDFINDPEFARQVAEEDMGLAKAVLDSIRNALRMLRKIFASGSIDDDTHMNSLFRELDIMAEAEKLWLDAYKVAVRNSSIDAMNAWQDDVNAQSSYSLGYHAGDLGKSTVDDYAHQGYSRGTGHFGFGTYFVGDEEQINYGNYGKRKHEAVDFDKYNLFEPRNFDQALKLHDALRLIDGFITEYSDFNQYERFTPERSERKWDNTRRINNAAEELVSDYEWNEYKWDDSTLGNKEKVDKYIADNFDDYDRNELERKARQKYEEEQSKSVDEDEVRSELARQYNIYKDMKDFWGDPFVRESSEEEYVQKHLEDTIRIRTENKEIPYDYYYYAEAQNAIKDASEHWEWKDSKLGDLASDLQSALGYKFGERRIIAALKETERIVSEYKHDPNFSRLDAEPGLDSGATVFMKQLGYEGVDVRHISEMDNTGYGSVIYDLKDEDLARKKEIGTARFSISDKAYDELNEEEQQAIHEAVSPDIRFSMPTERDVLPKARYKSDIGFSNAISAISGKQARINALEKNGFSKKQAEQIGEAISNFILDTGNWIESDLQSEFTFIGWDDLINAEVSVRKDWKGKVVGVSVSAMVANGEYPVNFDLTTICNKREGIMQVIQELTRIKTDTGKSVLDSVKLTDEDMWSINKALKAEGIDTACLGCFVEARRYYTNRFIASIDNKWNTAVRETRRQLGLPEEEYFDFAHGKKVTGEDYTAISDLWTSYEKSKDTKKSPEQRIRILMNEIIKNNEVDSPYLKLVSASDILTPEGISGLKQISTGKHDLVKTLKSIYGTSAPKEILAFTPYNSEIALLPKNLKRQRTDKYLRSIGGIRIQSFSDFKIEHVIDHMQMVADMAARKFTCHAYSKVIAFPRIFGLTGQKINMSVMFDITPAEEWQKLLGCSEEKAKEYAFKYAGLRFVQEKPAENPDNRPYIETEIEGVNGYLTYLLGDADYINSVYEEEYQKNIAAGMDENEARRRANEAKPFEQSINYREAVELENQDGYKENVGIIAVAYGDEHLKILLADPNVRYVIPYHKSGLPVFVSEKTSLQYARNYEPVQNTKKADPAEKLQERYDAFKKNYKGDYPAIAFFGDIYDKGGSIATTEATATEAAKLHGTGEFDVYKDLDKAKDIKEVSNAYLEDCIENNLVPVFSEFAGDPNYYKMLFDFAVTDGTSDHIYPQKTVRNNYPGIDIDAKMAAGEKVTDNDYAKLREAIRKGASEENAKNQTRSENMQNVLDDILSKDSENSILAGTNVNAIRDSATDYTNPKGVMYSITPEMDDAYMDAVNSGNMEEAQKLVDDAARMAGFITKRFYHGTPNFGFTVFDGTGFRDHDGWFFADRKDAAESYAYGDEAGTYSVYLNLENPLVIDAEGQDWTDIQAYTSLEARDRAKEIDARLDEIRDAWRSGTDNGEYDRLLDELDELESEASGGDTDSWVALAKENGHDGLIIRNIIDYGASYEGESYEPFTETIAFDNRQIKSADTITYAEDGSVIPLSERFDPTNNDIRYSLPTQDSDGNILTDGQMEYFQNSQARDAEGRLLVLYHHSDALFESFDPGLLGTTSGDRYPNTAFGFFVTDDVEFSKQFGKNQYKLYANAKNIMIHPYGANFKYSPEECEAITRRWFEVIDPEQFDYYEKLREEDPSLTLYDYYMDMTLPGESPYEYADYEREVLEDLGFDAVEIVEGIREGTDIPTTSYALFNREQPKFIDNANPTDAPEMRFSISGDESTMTYAAENAKSTDDIWSNDPEIAEGRVRYSMSKEDFVNASNKKYDDMWKSAYRPETLDVSEKNIRKLIMAAMETSDTNARYRQNVVNRTISKAKIAYNYLHNGDSKKAAETLFDHSLYIIENLEFFVEDKDFIRWKELRTYLKSTPMTLAKEDRDADYPLFRQTNFGTILLVNEGGIDPTEAWDELHRIWPDVYTENIKNDPNAILKQTEYATKILKPLAQAYTSEECMDLASTIANDILDIIYQGDEWQPSELYNEKASAMKQRHGEATRVVQRSIQNMRKQYTGKIKSIKQKNANKDAKKKYRQKHRQLYNKVLDEYKILTNMLLNPSKERTKNIPEQLRQPLAEMLAVFDLEKERSKKLEEKYMIPTRTQINLRQFKDALEKVAKEEGAETEMDAYFNFIKGKIEDIADKMDKTNTHTIDALSNDDMNDIKDMLNGLIGAIKNWHQLEIDGESYQAQVKCDELGEGAIEHQKMYGKAKKYGGTMQFLNNIVNMGELTPIYFFRQIKGLYDMYRELRKGFDSYVENEKVIIDKIADILSPYYKTNRKGKRTKGILSSGSTIEDWRHSESAETFDLTYGSITLTTAQKMSLYCLAKRDATKSHMFSDNGGIVASEITAGSLMHKASENLKGKTITAEHLSLTPADVATIIDTLTDEQKNVADQLQQLMSKDMSDIGNETSMKLLSIKMYKEENYFPIKVQGDSRGTKLDQIGMREKVRNPGFSNPLKDNASNPIIIDDIFSVVASHCNEMNMYAAYAVPLTNFMKVYNGSVVNQNGIPVKVKELLRQTYGDKAIQYIENFLDDINGNSFKRNGGLDDVLDKALGQAKKAAVFANFRVALQQPTAIVRALAVMDFKYFFAIFKPEKGVVEEMLEHCPIAQWKNWGYYDTHFGRDIEDVMMGNNTETFLSNIMSDMYGKLDNVTWGGIWQMVKAEIEDTHPDVEKGSDEYWRLCSERASFVFDTTQVVDSPFHRSNDMRSKNGLVKQLTSFQAEPTLSFNVLRQVFVDAIETGKKGDKGKATMIIAKGALIWLAQAGLVALAQSVIDALRRKGHKDDDDEEDLALAWYQEWLKYFKKNYGKNFGDDVNPINNVYYFKDIIPPILNALSGEYVFGQQNLTFQWVDTLTNGIEQCKKKWEKGEAYKKTWYDCITELAGGVGYGFGIPVKTMSRGIKNAFHWANKITGVTVFADDGKVVDKSIDEFVDRFRSNSDGGEGDGNGLMDFIANKMGYQPTEEKTSTDKTSSSTKGSADKDEKSSAESSEVVSDNDALKAIEEKAEKKAAGLSGDELDTVLWDTVMEGYTKKLDAGDMDYIEHLELIYMNNGGDLEKFHAKLKDSIDSAYKKTLKDDMSKEDINNQWRMKMKMESLGYTDQEISDICYHSEKARDLKAAMRIGVQEYIDDELSVLVQAGLTREDYEKLYKYRNYGAKSYDGKYTDPKYTKTTGRFIWPTDGQITSYFGYRNAPTRGASSNHPAIDIGAPMGSTVVAADGGVVIYAGTNGGYGNSVGVKHANGMVTYYNHLSAWNVKVGDQVAQGQPIANVGSTGISTGSHLDFKILDADGEPVDPLKYLSSRS